MRLYPRLALKRSIRRPLNGNIREAQFTRVEARVRWSWIRRVFPAPFNLAFPICNSLHTVRDHTHFTPSHKLGHRHPYVRLQLANIEGDDTVIIDSVLVRRISARKEPNVG